MTLVPAYIFVISLHPHCFISVRKGLIIRTFLKLQRCFFLGVKISIFWDNKPVNLQEIPLVVLEKRTRDKKGVCHICDIYGTVLVVHHATTNSSIFFLARTMRKERKKNFSISTATALVET